MAKPELLTVPQNLYEPVETAYRTVRRFSSSFLWEYAESDLRNLLNLKNLEPSVVFHFLLNYMVTMFEIYRHQSERSLDPVTKELVGEIMLSLICVFQETKEDLLPVLIDYCRIQMDEAMDKNDQTAWHQWSLIQMSLQKLINQS